MSDSRWQALAQHVNDKNKVGREKLSIWGGRCNEDAVVTLMEKWPALGDMPYRIWEFSSETRFERGTIPDNYKWLERARLFGAGGDLSLRREGDEFRWWFVGPTNVRPPDGFDDDDGDFWRAEPDATFYETKETTLLWGERRANGNGQWWFEDRVANADLSYPVDGEPGRVQIEYLTYSRAGRVEFVWLKRLAEHKGGA